MHKTAAASDVVEVTLDPEELEDKGAIQQLYEQKLLEQKERSKRENFSDMVASKAAQQKRKLAAREDAKKDTFKF